MRKISAQFDHRPGAAILTGDPSYWPDSCCAFFDSDLTSSRDAGGFCLLGLWVGIEALYRVLVMRLPGAEDCYRSRRDFLELNLLA